MPCVLRLPDTAVMSPLTEISACLCLPSFAPPLPLSLAAVGDFFRLLGGRELEGSPQSISDQGGMCVPPCPLEHQQGIGRECGGTLSHTWAKGWMPRAAAALACRKNGETQHGDNQHSELRKSLCHPIEPSAGAFRALTHGSPEEFYTGPATRT